ncbi:MAG: DNA-processing protein DprA [Myxococcota bacterium]
MEDATRWDEALRRAALLRALRTPDRVARAVAAGEEPRYEDVEAAARELEVRGLTPWIPFAETGAPVLVVRGSPPERPGVAVVGARAADPYGLACAARVARDAVTLGRPVVSGGAEGCDAAAHRAAMDAGGTTVVVLGSGHDKPYPRAHLPLFDEAVDTGGAVVTCFWPPTPPGRHRFLKRNGVIASLAGVTVVARAGARSGALSTARAAMRAGRPVLAVPSDVGEGLGVGGNGLLAGGVPAVTGVSDLAAALGERASGAWPVQHGGAPDPWPGSLDEETRSDDGDVGPEAAGVMEALAEGAARDLEALLATTGLPVDTLMAVLVDLEVAGRVEQAGGQRFRLRRGG